MPDSAEKTIYERADIYHDFYQGRGKDYRAEATLILELIRDRNPVADSLLDVACGTGAHLRELAGPFETVVGTDLSPKMLEVAMRNTPEIPLHQGDMRDFRFDRRFDAVTCMFSSVGYLATADDLDKAVRNFADHVNPGGVVIVEPWWFPDNFVSGWVGADIVNVDGRTISRLSYSVRKGNASHMEVHYTVAVPETGIEHFTDIHVMTLFDRDSYEAAFRKAELTVEYVKHEQAAPGMFVGYKP
ncbi:class I SAM-dependent DNA methyltransferase [Amycolatopsis palatopharyngis]|uniref:class I SAM-dependent DNA methyltransferase n=1 Tax=Amycolatopsis palatopharyngis TaxID=187982 RepID=UPI000E279FA4|nr:class I SAM-dependent methyltransferase [Amycolatopsis palatopharyngis]